MYEDYEMKKMTAALFTAAAMGVSGFAVADEHSTGPDFSGQVDFRYLDTDETEVSGGALSNVLSRLAVSGAGTGINGLSTGYYARLTLVEGDGSGIDYGFVSLGGSVGTLSVGIDDDLVYKYVGARTDQFRSQGPVGAAVYSAGYIEEEGGHFGNTASVQFNGGVDALSFGTYVDTAEGDGVERVQVAAALDLGMGSIGVAYSDRDSASGQDIFIGGTLDLDVISFNATFADDEAGNNPYVVTAQAPLSDVFTFTLGYSDTDTGETDYNGQLLADLGGGLSSHIGYRTGDSDDGVVVGIRYTF